MLGVMMDVTSPFHAQLIESLHEASERLGYDLVLSTVTRLRSEERAIETLLDSGARRFSSWAPSQRLNGSPHLPGSSRWWWSDVG